MVGGGGNELTQYGGGAAKEGTSSIKPIAGHQQDSGSQTNEEKMWACK